MSDEKFNKILRQIRNNKITSLKLSENNIGDGGARRLSEALKKNQSLTSLVLVDNNIGDEGARSLSEALEKNQSLTSLDLWGNDIGEGGERVLAETLNHNTINCNTSLSFLYIKSEISEHGKIRVSESSCAQNYAQNKYLTQAIWRYLFAILRYEKITEQAYPITINELQAKQQVIDYFLTNVLIVSIDARFIINLAINKLNEYENSTVFSTEMFENSVKQLASQFNKHGVFNPKDSREYNIALKYNCTLSSEFIKKINQLNNSNTTTPNLSQQQTYNNNLIDNGEYIKALKHINKYMKNPVNKSSLILQKVKIVYKIGEFDEAEEYFNEALSLNEINVSHYENSVEWFKENNMLDKAIKLQRKIIDKAPTSIRYQNLAKLYITQDKFIKTVESYDEAIDLAPGNKDIYLEKAKLLYDKGFKTDFNSTLSEANIFSPKKYLELAEWLEEEKNDKSLACDYYEKACQLSRIIDSKTLWKLVNLYEELEKPSMAISKLETLEEQENGEGLTPIYFKLAKLNTQINNLEYAIECYDEILELQSRNYEAHLYKGQTLTKLGNYEVAKEEFDRCCLINMRLAEPYIEKANICVREENREEALATLNHAYKLAGVEDKEKISNEIAKINQTGEEFDRSTSYVESVDPNSSSLFEGREHTAADSSKNQSQSFGSCCISSS